MRSDQEPAQNECISLAYRRLANAMILSTLREISRQISKPEVEQEATEIDFVESQRIKPWCELAGLEADTVRRAARKLVGQGPP
jgi:hypothetical protein